MSAFDSYYGKTEYLAYGELIRDQCSGMIISKRRDEANLQNGLIYEAKRIGIEDFYDLLKALEGMCHNGLAREIDDSHYKVF
jgi:hypothetical protein